MTGRCCQIQEDSQHRPVIAPHKRRTVHIECDMNKRFVIDPDMHELSSTSVSIFER
jgi:hypothetical protein